MKNEKLEACPAAELLSRYFNKELPRKEMRAVEDHIGLCPMCLAALERLQKVQETGLEEVALPENWPEIEKSLDKGFYAYLESAPTPPKQRADVSERRSYLELLRKKWQGVSEALLTPQKLAYAGALVILVIVGLYSYTYLSRSDYFHLAQIEPERKGVLRTETAAPTTLTEGLRFFGEGKYERANAELRMYLKENPDHYAANYYLGLSYLFAAEVRLPGLSYKFDDFRVDQGITYLERALALSGENQFYQEDCYWYLGKASLMRGDLGKAKEQFGRILKLSQPNLMRKDEARAMLHSLSVIASPA